MINPLSGSKVILGVTGSIACYKAADLASKLTQEGAQVDVILTQGASNFITPLTFRSLTHRPIITDLFDVDSEQAVAHVAMAHSADIIVVAPATAHFIAKLAHGMADDALGCVALALRPEAKVLVAPAMNGSMWRHPATVANVATLTARGAEFLGPDDGLLSCGYAGIGRLWPVDGIANRALELLGLEQAND